MADEVVTTPDSILENIKDMIGGMEGCDQFDTDIIIHINTALSILTQLGVGPSTGFSIRDKTSVWTDFIADDKRLEMVKTYVYMKVKIIFDPPLNASVLTAMKESIKEFEWRINVTVD